MDSNVKLDITIVPVTKKLHIDFPAGGTYSLQTWLYINNEEIDWNTWPNPLKPGTVWDTTTKVNEPVTVYVTPDAGNKAVVTVNGEQVEVIDGKASFVMDEDKNVVVSYVPAVYSVSFDIGAGGSLYVTGNAYSSSEDKYYEWFDQNLGTNTTSNYSFASGQTLTMTLVPDSGKKAVAYVDGVEVPVAADNTVSFVNNANTSFKVEFIDIPSSVTAGAPVTSPNYAAIIDGKSYTSAYSIVMYGNVTMNGSEVLKECGYRITMLDEEGNAKGDALTLKAVGGLSDNVINSIR